jgi:hypothetical protein
MAEFYRDQMQLAPQEADARAREPMAAERREQLLAGPQDQVSWYALNSLAEHDPDAAWAVWERLKRDAQTELASGHRAVRAIEFCTGPWERAQFLAVRASLME